MTANMRASTSSPVGFLAEMEQVIAWAILLNLVQPFQPKAGGGQPPYPFRVTLNPETRITGGQSQWPHGSFDGREPNSPGGMVVAQPPLEFDFASRAQRIAAIHRRRTHRAAGVRRSGPSQQAQRLCNASPAAFDGARTLTRCEAGRPHRARR